MSAAPLPAVRDPLLNTCDYCELPVDMNGYGYRLLWVGAQELVQCKDCEAEGRHL